MDRTQISANAMAGVVYVITNRAMPGLVKVGFSTRDSRTRAKELNHTGVPFEYKVVFEMETHAPQRVEREVHRTLREHRQGKEWFRCSVAIAVSAIRDACTGVPQSDISSPLVPGHPLSVWIPSSSTSRSEREVDAEGSDPTPFPPGHPLRKFYE